MKVLRATDVGVGDRRAVRSPLPCPAIKIVLEDRVDGCVGARADLDRPATGRFQALRPVCLSEFDDADTCPEALLGMRFMTHDNVDERLGGGTDFAGLAHDPLRCPVGVTAMCTWHVLAHRRVPFIGGPTHMGGDTLAVIKDLNRAGCKARPQLSADQCVRHRVVVLLDLDVIVETGLALLPLGMLVRLLRQGFEGRTIELLEEFTPTSTLALSRGL